MAKRLFDIVAALAALLALSPVLLLAALGIRASSRGPVLYRTSRAGKDGRPFTMHKFRTMVHSGGPGSASAITCANDRRVFWFGRILRRLKIDELPQLIDVLRGAMTIVGPRPEDLRIVHDHYAPEHWETLRVRPGLASPGSIYSYTHGERLIGSEHPERDYLLKLLPLKLALDRFYVGNADMIFDFRLIVRTLWVMVQIGLGRRDFPEPSELGRIEHVVPARLAGDSDALSLVSASPEYSSDGGTTVVSLDLKRAA